MIGDKMRRESRWTSAGGLPPANWSLHPMANRIRLFLGIERHSFSRNFRAGSRAAPVPLKGPRVKSR